MGNGSEIEKKGVTTLQQYGSFELEEMQEASAALPTGGGGDFFKPHVGKNTVRFLLPLQGRKGTKIWYKHFYSVGGDKKTVVCAKYQYKQPCPVCERGAKLAASPNKVDQRKARSFSPTAHVYANIVDMANPEKGVQLWKMSSGVFKGITAAIDLAGVGKTFADPVEGFNVLFMRSGEGMKTKYEGYTVARKPSPLPDAAELMANQVDVEQAESEPTDEQQDEAAGGEYEDRLPYEKPTAGRAQVRQAPRAASAPISYDEDDAELG
jgi:hypothetical protein